MSDSLRPCGLYSPWNSLGQNTGVGSLSLLQGIFPTQGLNPGLPHCRQIAYHLSHQGNILLLLTHLTLQPYFVDIIIIFIILQIMKLKQKMLTNMNVLCEYVIEFEFEPSNLALTSTTSLYLF